MKMPDKKRTNSVGDTSKRKKIRKIRTKLLLFIVPIVMLTIILLVTISTMLSRRQLIKMAKSQLESSITNQGDNIESWLNENLKYFSTVKNDIEKTGADTTQLQTILDANYGFNKNAPDGLYVGTSSGQMYKASESQRPTDDPTSLPWFTQGLTRVNMAFGPAYQAADGTNVISATGILNDGSDDVKVIGADVKINKISVIVNSGVKMENASSILIDTSKDTILASRDTKKLNTTVNKTDGSKLYSGIAQAIDSGKTDTQTIGDYEVTFREIQGTDWMLVSYIKTSVIMEPVAILANTLIAIGLVAVILVIILILGVVSKVVAPISDITKHIKSMSEGDFTIDVNVNSNDEIGMMGDRIGEFVESMRKMLQSINGESRKLQEESDNSDSVSKAMYSASTTQGEAMKQLNETVDQLATAVNDIAENATTLAMVVTDTRENSDKANSSMSETVEISRAGRDDMEKLNVAMQGIQSANGNLVDSINNVGKASEEITNIVGMIGEIAEETNLLSLNASIEAARAGEAGRGFAVVASQIGKLAQTSAESAQNIGSLIDKVRELITDAVGQANNSARSIEENSKMIEAAVQTFDRIYNNIQESNNIIHAMIEDVEKVDEVATNVAAISEEQAASAEEILATSNNMVEQADNITKSSQDVADNSHELANTSETLTNYVQKFKI
jgi:methyl-accepting chemotaxis protein